MMHFRKHQYERTYKEIGLLLWYTLSLFSSFCTHTNMQSLRYVPTHEQEDTRPARERQAHAHRECARNIYHSAPAESKFKIVQKLLKKMEANGHFKTHFVATWKKKIQTTLSVFPTRIQRGGTPPSTKSWHIKKKKKKKERTAFETNKNKTEKISWEEVFAKYRQIQTENQNSTHWPSFAVLEESFLVFLYFFFLFFFFFRGCRYLKLSEQSPSGKTNSEGNTDRRFPKRDRFSPTIFLKLPRDSASERGVFSRSLGGVLCRSGATAAGKRSSQG